MLSSFIDATLGFLGNAQQNAYNREMAEYQNNFNLKMWHMQNSYNSPNATMQRLTDAGINPRAYQQIGTFANSEKPYEAAEMNKISEISAYQGLARQHLENKLLEQQVDKGKAQTDYTKALDVLSRNKSISETDKRRIDGVKFALFLADNGIEDQGLTSGLSSLLWYNKDGQEIPFGEIGSVKKMIQTFNDRYDAKMTSQELLNRLRNFEALTKGERYRLLKHYGVDTESDSIMGAIRLAIRLLEKQ